MKLTKSTIPIYHGRKWPVGLLNASRRLNVSVGHLFLVLTGARTSRNTPKLIEDYEELVKELKGGVK